MEVYGKWNSVLFSIEMITRQNVYILLFRYLQLPYNWFCRTYTRVERWAVAITLFVHGYTCWRFPCRRESRIFCEYQFITIIFYSLLNSLQFNNVLFIIDILCKPCKWNKEIDLYLDNKLTLWRIYSNTHILYTK